MKSMKLHTANGKVPTGLKSLKKKRKKEYFFNDLRQKWPELLRHDFLARSQASYFTEKKESVEDGEFIVCLDFAENYSLFVQDAIQSHHLE
ncbi:unnamed protein product [Psylliodes chrysocephalus]|uniref:Uncharacterized protein n=1 Tax=Psylliodes chrysocephalus TaxID=3402493 RepID=A0A9P0GBG4_9CUCU|nr:unnamed protein product [Psylliodes chrysocephala]